ncbi:MAG: PhnA domain-containing protein [Bacteroidota bacterium]
MSVEQQVISRSNNQCELCKSTNKLSIYDIPPATEKQASHSLYVCEKCKSQLEKKEELDINHWSCLNESMWSEVPAVQVVSWRMLNRLKNESWASDALDMMYLDDDNLVWAKAMGDHENSGEASFHRDANGIILQNGDNVVLTKSLDVKGSSANAKVGTIVRNIKLVSDNVEQIEGKIDDQLIVILTKYLRKN